MTDVSIASPDDFKLKASVGAMVFATPKYEGSDIYQPLYMPEIDLQYGPFFTSVSQGAGIYIPVNESRSLIFAPALRWRVKRNLGEPRDAIEYIGDVRPTVTLNTILKLDPIMFNFRMTDGLSDSNKGASFNIGTTWQNNIGNRTNITLYATAIYGNKSYNQTYFGITKVESVHYGYEVYNAYSGFKSVDVGGIFKYFVTDNISIDFHTEFLRLVGSAAKSPITFEKNQMLFGFGATYVF